MNNIYFQSLLEGVKRRTSSGSIPIYHKKSPIGKFVSKQSHDEAMSSKGEYNAESEPLYHSKIYPLITKGINRGKIGNTKNISYRFAPKLEINKNRIVHKNGTESGNHYYEFKTDSNNDVEVRIHHTPKRKSSKSTSHILFDVDGMLERGSKQDRSKISTAVQVFRGVSTAIKHHIRSHNPDIIKFTARDDFGHLGDSRDRSKLYKYMVKKLSRTHTSSVKQTKHNDENDGMSTVTNFILTRKNRTRKAKR